MSDVHTRSLISAAAGSGKTVQIVRRYLHELSQGVDASQIVAITFTRKAAAELVERISRVLRVAVGKAAAEKGDQELYLQFAPSRAVCLQALAALPSAPVSTVDSFVHGLVSEFLLDAAFECPDGSKAWIDGPLAPSANEADAFQEAARDALEMVDDSGELDADAAAVLSEMSLSDAIVDVALLAQREAVDPMDNQDILAAAGESALGLTSNPNFDDMATKAFGDSPEGLVAIDSLKAWKRGPAPPALLPWLTHGYRKAAFKELRHEILLATLKKVLKPTRIESLVLPAEWKKTTGWHHGDAMARADALRSALWRISRMARGLALCQMAQSGEPDHTELMRVAIKLCRQAHTAKAGTKLSSLATRYRVLMVDEVQDTNPDQLAFYEAFQDMQQQMSVLFLGDVRQSIYRFRGGEPEGWAKLIDGTPEGARGALDTNYRSAHALVAFQKCFFERLHCLGERGVAPLGALQAASKPGENTPTSTVLPQPVVVVDLTKDDDSKRLPLAAFARRLGADWQLSQSSIALPPGAKPDETAAVLVRGWSVAAQAARELSVYGIQAQVVGDKSLLSSRAATDLRLWLRALLDVTVEIAWMGILKHPSIGLTDGALPHLRPFGLLLMAENDEQIEADVLAPLGQADAARLRVAIPLLAQRRRRIGRESTAVLLEELVSVFHWRPLMSAGPEGMRAVAELDILLDVVRSTEANGVDPKAVVSALSPAEGDTDNLAKVRLQKAGPTVEVTTVFSAKGLEYDHVCVLQADDKGSSGVHGSQQMGRLRRAGVIESPARHYLAVKLDPSGALDVREDPLTNMAKMLVKSASREEGFRLLYVALTRASKTLTFGVPPADKASANPASAMRRALGLSALAAAKGETPVIESLPEGVMVLRSDEPEQAALLQRPESTVRTFTQREDTGGIDVLWAPEEGRDIRSPSSWAEGKQDGGALKAAYMAKARMVSGSKPAPKLPLIDHLHITAQGDLVHGWLEAWAFNGEPTKERALDFLKSDWSSDDAVLAQDLCDIGAHMLAELPAFSEMVRDAKALHFELPLLAEVDGDILTGLADLVVDHEDGTTTIIDFKAGAHFAQQGANGAIDVPGLSTYAWQLEAYKTALEAAGRTVKETGLVYVRGPSWVRF